MVFAALIVDGDAVSTRTDEITDVADRIGDHQMNIEKQLGVRTEGGNDRGAERDVGDKDAVHDIEMQPICTCRFHGGDVCLKICKVCCKQ